MLVRVVKSAPGCVYQPGSLLKVTEKKANLLIEAGIAEPADGKITYPPETLLRRGAVANDFTKPPRHICKCGFVAKSASGLKNHQRSCEWSCE